MNFLPVTMAWAEHALWAESPGIRIKVPPAKAGLLRQYAGQRVMLGVRPEALRPANGSDPAEYSFDSKVEVVEPLGAEILLNVRAGENAIVARVDPGVRVKVHENVRLALDPARVHFFDAASEAAL